MDVESIGRLALVTDVIRCFELTTLLPSLRACEQLAGDNGLLDVAVLGQFKSGKSSLLNAILGEPVFPVGSIPVTAVITRATAGASRIVRVRHDDGTAEEVAADRIAEFVTEAGNPENRRKVAVVDVFTPTLSDSPGVRLVDTPGLGSVFRHNTETTRSWMPNVAVALVAVSSERPLSDEDRRLIAEARETAPRVVVVLTKVDLLSDSELTAVTAFLERGLREHFGGGVAVLPFSCRVGTDRHLRGLREAVLLPVCQGVAEERRAAIAFKLTALTRACCGYLAVGLEAAQRAHADRQRLRAAVLDESVNAAVIRDELRLVEQGVRAKIRPGFEAVLLPRAPQVERQLTAALASELKSWRGNLAEQTGRYEAWMAERLTAELKPMSDGVVPCADDLLRQAEQRFRRVIEAFRDRLNRNVKEAMGVAISPASWEARQPGVAVIPVAVSRTFMTNWDLLWWMLPMGLVGGLFRRHVIGRVSWEVTKNLTRLIADWVEAVDRAVADLRHQASEWVDTELATLERLLGQRGGETEELREALRRLQDVSSH
ncbi:MAG: dynamin family protein [Gemmataceae bacterium]|nr:dynamin family protein [Gemmataceae bacterium]